jgi:hypothetical protein
MDRFDLTAARMAALQNVDTGIPPSESDTL